jgi:polysaccharide export outer membrane protein
MYRGKGCLRGELHMDGKLGKVHLAGRRIVFLGLTVCLLAGCGVGPGGRGFTLFPEGHPLLDTAKELRQPPAATLGLPRELQKRPLPLYVVEPGDVLLVQPADLDSPVRLPGDQAVLLDGTINLGRYGLALVVGKTVPEIEVQVRAIVKAQSQDKDPGVLIVRIVSRQSKVYYVLGEVNAPGAFPLNGRETVLDGLVAAGGLTDRASRSNIILSRPTSPNHCRVVLPVCYEEIIQLGDTTTNYQLAPGDRIYVSTRTCWQTMFGERHNKDGCCGGPQTACPLDGHDAVPPDAPAPAAPPVQQAGGPLARLGLPFLSRR